MTSKRLDLYQVNTNKKARYLVEQNIKLPFPFQFVSSACALEGNVAETWPPQIDVPRPESMILEAVPATRK